MTRRSLSQPKVRFALVAALIGLLGVAALYRFDEKSISYAQGPNGTVTHTMSGNTDVWRIDQPNVKQNITEYTQIKFQPGDRITIQANGCVQTGGFGDTWKRYVNPSGSDSDKKYHGLIQIPGATAGLVRFAAITRAIGPSNMAWQGTLSIPRNFVSAGGLFLRLGYEDSDYSDDGYSSHDNGNNDQCKASNTTYGGPAWVSLQIEHGAGGATQSCASPYDLDLGSADWDLNGLPLNPRWCAQDNTQHPALPSQTGSGAGACSKPWQAPCTSQAPTIVDLPEWYDPDPYDQGAKFCALSGPLGKHVNWALVTYEGAARWESHSDSSDIKIDPPSLPDDDYNINISRGDQAAYTQQNSDDVHTEFDSDETIDHFNTPWWKQFHQSVDNGSLKKGAAIGTEVIEIGELGLDCAHSCGSEIHPVLALAVHAQENLSDDVWAIFARNSGNEGFCGHASIMHPELSTIYLALPWPDGAALVPPVVKDASTWEKRGGGQPQVTSFPFTTGTKPVYVVQIDLGDANTSPLVDGELHLQWTPKAPSVAYRRTSPRLGTAVRGPSPMSAVQRPSVLPPDPEAVFAKIVAGLPEDTRKRISQLLSTKPAAPRSIQLNATNLRQPPGNFAVKTRIAGRPTLRKGRVVPPNQQKKDLYTNLGKILKGANVKFPSR